MVIRVFWVCTNKAELMALKVVPERVDVLISAGRFWSGRTFRVPKWVRQPWVNWVFLDSGAQQFLTTFRKYPYTVERYSIYVRQVRPDFVATMDYPLDITVGLRGESWKESINRTVENAVRLIEIHERDPLPSKIVVVIQGLEPWMFLECLDLYFEYGLKKWKYWAIGSLCMVKSISRLVHVCMLLRRRLGGDKFIHVFGPDVRTWPKIRYYVDSVDTSMWQRLRAMRFLDTGRIIPPCLNDSFKELRKVNSSKARQLSALWFYQKYVKKIKMMNQSTLL